MFSCELQEFLEFWEIARVFFLEFTKICLVYSPDEFTEFEEEFFSGFAMRELFESEFVTFDTIAIERSC